MSSDHKLVPIEPTEKMIGAALDADDTCWNEGTPDWYAEKLFRAVWAAMIYAADPPETLAGEDCGATNMQVLGFACDHERCPMIIPNNDSLAEMLEGTRDALEKALARVQKLESANSALANQVLIYARRAEDTIQLRNLLEAVREDNQRLRAELSEIRAQDSDLAERDEPLTPEDKALLDRAWEKHAAAKP